MENGAGTLFPKLSWLRERDVFSSWCLRKNVIEFILPTNSEPHSIFQNDSLGVCPRNAHSPIGKVPTVGELTLTNSGTWTDPAR